LPILQNKDTTFFSVKYLGMANYFNLKPEQAKHHLERALAYDSTDFDTYLILGDIYLQLNQQDKSLKNYNKAVSLTFPPPKKHAELYVGLSNVYNVKREWDKATEYLELACKSNPQDMSLVFRLAAYHDYKKDYAKALVLYQQVTEQGNPTSLKAQIKASKTRIEQLNKFKTKDKRILP
jgi:tetratricopeptide (TPR) repeat protein